MLVCLLFITLILKTEQKQLGKERLIWFAYTDHFSSLREPKVVTQAGAWRINCRRDYEGTLLTRLLAIASEFAFLYTSESAAQK